MNTGYTIYQVERTKSAAEQREVDRSNAQLAAAISRLWDALSGPDHGSSRFRGNVPRNCVRRFRGNARSRRDEERARRLSGRAGRPGRCAPVTTGHHR
jgi:hypothetical protein